MKIFLNDPQKELKNIVFTNNNNVVKVSFRSGPKLKTVYNLDLEDFVFNFPSYYNRIKFKLYDRPFSDYVTEKYPEMFI